MNGSDYKYTPEQKREIGKSFFFNSNSDFETKKKGLELIIEASKQRDAEAIYLVARLILDKVLKADTDDQEEHALSLMCSSANSGCIQARAFLNAYCENRYQEQNKFIVKEDSTALVDFDGQPIKVNRKGLFTPVDALLEYKEGKNILTLSTSIMFVYGEEVSDPECFEQAVCRGILAWQGEYEVFGGQKLSVRVNLTQGSNAFDTLVVLPITEGVSSAIQSMGSLIAGRKNKSQLSDIMKNKRSFAFNGPKWTVNSRKIIFIQSENGRFDDYEEIMHVTKHEFGHALGLGDLYANIKDSLVGVEKGTYFELDSYAINNKYYNLVMCDHHGPVSNNDIEMVILAYRENKMQLYQPSRLKGKISSALGKGN